MREILFRGKGIDNGELVEGFLTKRPSAIHIGDYSPWYISVPPVDPDDSGGYYNVDPDTVGQYTGMKDMGGNRIFEGDIVAFKRVNALGYTTSRIGEVKYFDELPVFYIMATTGDAWDWYQCQEIQIIGNVHDHPELLKDGDTSGQNT